MKKKVLFFLITFLSLQTFSQKKKERIVEIKNKFEEKEVKWFKESGEGVIKGTAKFESKKGKVRFGSEFRIELQPYSAYTYERLFTIYKNEYKGHVFVEDGVPKFTPDPKGYHETRKTMCNNKGEFVFSNLPDGEYYIIAFMLWDKTGGGLMQKIKLSKGETKIIEMTNF